MTELELIEELVRTWDVMTDQGRLSSSRRAAREDFDIALAKARDMIGESVIDALGGCPGPDVVEKSDLTLEELEEIQEERR